MRVVARDRRDEELPVAAARAGDATAWDALFRRYQLPLFTYAMDLVRNHQASLDIVQETFIRAVRHLAGLHEDSRFGSWLFGIAHQQVVQHWRRHGRSLFSDEPIPETCSDPEPDPRFQLMRAEESTALLAAVDALPPVQRSAILLYFLESFSIEEIAEATGTSPGTVKSRLHYAKRTLRTTLDRRLSPP